MWSKDEVQDLITRKVHCSDIICILFWSEKKMYHIESLNTTLLSFSYVKNFLLNENNIMIYGTMNNELLVCVIHVNKTYYIVFTIIFN